MNIAVVLNNVRVEQWITDVIEQLTGITKINIAFFFIIDKNNGLFDTGNSKMTKQSLLVSGLNILSKKNIDAKSKQIIKTTNASDVNYITKQLQEKQVDCILNLSSILPEDILRTFQYEPDYGVWEFELLNDLLLRNFSSIYYQRLDKHAIALELVSCKSSGRSIVFSAKIRNIHYIINRNVIQLVQLLNVIVKKVFSNNYTSEFIPVASRNNALHGNRFFDPALLILRTFIDFCINLFKSLVYADSWQIWVFKCSIKNVMEGKFDSEIEFKLVPENANTYYADPFLYLKDGNVGVYLEEYLYGNSTGYLRYFDSKQKSIVPVKVKDYDMAYHVSYPFLIEHKGVTYCVPETGDAREVAIYRLTDDPAILIREKVIISGISLVDVSIIYYNDKYWLFACENESKGLSNTALKIYYADDLFSEWKEHTCNPVKLDVTSSRPAGKLFMYEGKLFRPAQDCSRAYGDRIIINQISRLSETEFSEEVFRIIEAKEIALNAIGIHTINFDNDLCTVDLKFRRKNSISSLLTKIRSHLK